MDIVWEKKWRSKLKKCVLDKKKRWDVSSRKGDKTYNRIGGSQVTRNCWLVVLSLGSPYTLPKHNNVLSQSCLVFDSFSCGSSMDQCIHASCYSFTIVWIWLVNNVRSIPSVLLVSTITPYQLNNVY